MKKKNYEGYNRLNIYRRTNIINIFQYIQVSALRENCLRGQLYDPTQYLGIKMPHNMDIVKCIEKLKFTRFNISSKFTNGRYSNNLQAEAFKSRL